MNEAILDKAVILIDNRKIKTCNIFNELWLLVIYKIWNRNITIKYKPHHEGSNEFVIKNPLIDELLISITCLCIAPNIYVHIYITFNILYFLYHNIDRLKERVLEISEQLEEQLNNESVFINREFIDPEPLGEIEVY